MGQASPKITRSPQNQVYSYFFEFTHTFDEVPVDNPLGLISNRAYSSSARLPPGAPVAESPSSMVRCWILACSNIGLEKKHIAKNISKKALFGEATTESLETIIVQRSQRLFFGRFGKAKGKEAPEKKNIQNQVIVRGKRHGHSTVFFCQKVFHLGIRCSFLICPSLASGSLSA